MTTDCFMAQLHLTSTRQAKRIAASGVSVGCSMQQALLNTTWRDIDESFWKLSTLLESTRFQETHPAHVACPVMPSDFTIPSAVENSTKQTPYPHTRNELLSGSWMCFQVVLTEILELYCLTTWKLLTYSLSHSSHRWSQCFRSWSFDFPRFNWLACWIWKKYWQLPAAFDFPVRASRIICTSLT